LNEGSENSAIDIVTIFADPWTTKSPMPSARQSFATSVVNGKIYAIGGAYTVSIPNVSFTYYDVPIVEEYDPATDTWTTKISMPTTYRSQLAVGVVNDKIYVIGGEDGSESLSLVEEYEPN
jgi:N-acetylneuraminic acid mutarotase